MFYFNSPAKKLPLCPDLLIPRHQNALFQVPGFLTCFSSMYLVILLAEGRLNLIKIKNDIQCKQRGEKVGHYSKYLRKFFLEPPFADVVDME